MVGGVYEYENKMSFQGKLAVSGTCYSVASLYKVWAGQWQQV